MNDLIPNVSRIDSSSDAYKSSAENINLTSTKPAGIETEDSLKSHCKANSPGFDVQLLELSCHETKSV